MSELKLDEQDVLGLMALFVDGKLDDQRFTELRDALEQGDPDSVLALIHQSEKMFFDLVLSDVKE